MKRTLLFLFMLAVLSLRPVMAVDPGIEDTLRIDSIDAYAGGTAVLPLYIFNDEWLGMIDINLKFDDTYLTVDTFSFAGGVFTDFSEDSAIFRDSANLVNLFMADLDVVLDKFPPSQGLLCNLLFSVDPSAIGQVLVIDSAYWPLPPPGKKYTLFIDGNSNKINPHIVPGKIFVLPPPPSYDSVLVDSVGVIPGNSVAVNIYAYNEENIDSIDVALEISSSSLVYNQTIFDGTLGALAQDHTVLVSGQQILLSFKFPDASPLPPSRDVLATLVFDVPAEIPDELVTIDSAAYSGLWPLIFHTADDTRTFTPFFARGYVNIRHSVAVDEFDEGLLPREFALDQNTPNPFNPSTIISFALPRTSDVTLFVYNILGEKVRTLINERLQAGVHRVTFDGRDDEYRDLASGIYFYRIRAADFTQSKKMMLLK
ncbi:MAG: T9SS type A sorting domain-containing protein [Candidatus Zixiibacteriota bacterium]|nr:MAG: T9SS type A sorting domain-containing protein [candidate division Zixibacteria bacterium]